MMNGVWAKLDILRPISSSDIDQTFNGCDMAPLFSALRCSCGPPRKSRRLDQFKGIDKCPRGWVIDGQPGPQDIHLVKTVAHDEEPADPMSVVRKHDLEFDGVMFDDNAASEALRASVHLFQGPVLPHVER